MRQVSKKKRKQIEEEQEIRWDLIIRANGRCENCGELPDFRGLSPHEKVFRSQGGVMSIENTVMLCGRCHSKAHRIKEVIDE